MLTNNFSTSKCFAIFELIKFICFGSTLSYPHKEFLNPRPQQVQPAPAPHSSAGSRTLPANAGTRNPRGLTRPAQDSYIYSYTTFFDKPQLRMSWLTR